jgi:hypothetical protein
MSSNHHTDQNRHKIDMESRIKRRSMLDQKYLIEMDEDDEGYHLHMLKYPLHHQIDHDDAPGIGTVRDNAKDVVKYDDKCDRSLSERLCMPTKHKKVMSTLPVYSAKKSHQGKLITDEEEEKSGKTTTTTTTTSPVGGRGVQWKRF